VGRLARRGHGRRTSCQHRAAQRHRADGSLLLFLELSERLQLVGLATEREFDCPLNQYVPADALGLSAIHLNRVLRQLRERKLMILRDRKVTILDRAKLNILAGFQPQQAAHRQP
jgi:CRP-like cAMP-binding protein